RSAPARLAASAGWSRGVPERVLAWRILAMLRGATILRCAMVCGAMAGRDTRRSSAGRFRALVAVEAEVAELEAERVAGHAERRGGACLVAAVEAERLLDAAAFVVLGAVEGVAAAWEVEGWASLAVVVLPWRSERVGGLRLVR